MRDNFSESFDLVIDHEGGYSDHPEDNGGATNLGITIGVLSGWLGRDATKTEVRALTLADVKPIYKKNYWDVIKGDLLPSGLDYAIFDYAVNSGPGKAARALQKIVGTTVDGAIGPNTLKATEKFVDVANLIDELCDERLAFVRGLPDYKTFGRGWERRIADVRVQGGLMVKPQPSSVTEAGIAAVGIAVAAGGIADPTQSPEINNVVIGFGVVLILAAVIALIFKRKRNGNS